MEPFEPLSRDQLDAVSAGSPRYDEQLGFWYLPGSPYHFPTFEAAHRYMLMLAEQERG